MTCLKDASGFDTDRGACDSTLISGLAPSTPILEVPLKLGSDLAPAKVLAAIRWGIFASSEGAARGGKSENLGLGFNEPVEHELDLV